LGCNRAERKASKRRRIVSPIQGQPDRLVAGTIDFWHPMGVTSDF
jgi:hypothetical protein